LRRFLSLADRTRLRPLMKRPGAAGSKLQLSLDASDASQLPVQISVRLLAGSNPREPTIGMVLTDMTEARRSEEMLRALSHRVVQVQETERGRVAVDLHDHITQLLCAILFRCQALVTELSATGGPSMREAMSLREMLGTTAKEVERISSNLRPGVLDQLGLDAVMRASGTEFTERTGVPVKLDRVRLEARLPADAELALYRILQEALKNTEQHARAKHVSVQLVKESNFVVLTIKDDGIGFVPEQRPAKPKKKNGLGLLGMSERAAYVGGTFTIKSARRTGTQIEVRIPLPPDPTGVN
jgi:two-component system NarL family sensor kinase